VVLICDTEQIWLVIVDGRRELDQRTIMTCLGMASSQHTTNVGLKQLICIDLPVATTCSFTAFIFFIVLNLFCSDNAINKLVSFYCCY